MIIDDVTACKEQKKYDTRRSRGAQLLLFTRCDVFCDLLQYTHMENLIYLFYNKISNGLLKYLRGHEKRKTNPLTWSDVNLTPFVCLLIDHGQQRMKMDTEVTLLYNC